MMLTFDCKNYTRVELESYYPKTWFTNIPCELQSLISYIETNKLWNGQDIDKNIKSAKDKLQKDYFIRYDSKEAAYSFDYDTWKTKKVTTTGDIKTLQDLKIQDEITSKLLCSYWDDLFFESSRQKKCDTYNETTSTASQKGFVNQLCIHFTGTCYLADGTQFKWKDGSYKDFPDPRMYYNTTSGNYDLEKLKTDLRLFINTKYASMVGINAENSNLLQYNHETWLSMYAEYMYEKGYAEVEGASSSKQQSIKRDFYNIWGNTDETGYYWKWHTINIERLEQVKQKYLAKLAGEQALADYLQAIEQGKFYAYCDIGFGGLNIIGSVGAIIVSEGALTGVSVTSMAFAADQIYGGISALRAIEKGFFDRNTEYKFAKGIIVNNIRNPNLKFTISCIYDVSSIIVGATSGNVNITEFKLSGEALEKIVKAYAAGSDFTNITYGGITSTIQIKKKIQK